MKSDRPGECNSVFNSGGELFLNKDGVPIVRVCMAYSESSVDIKIYGKFSIFDRSGCALMENVKSDRKWRIKVKNGGRAKFQYGIVVGGARSKDEADRCALDFDKKGLNVSVEKTGIKYEFNNDIVLDTVRYKVIAGFWNSESEARKEQGVVNDEYKVEIVKKRHSRYHGKLEIFDSEYEKSLERDGGIRIVPQSDLFSMTLYDKKPGMDRSSMALPNDVEFVINDDGKIAVVTIFTLEDFLKRVLPKDFIRDASYEFLRAYAIAARGSYLYRLGLRSGSDTYDFLIDDEFAGNESDAKLIAEAIDATRGTVITNENQLCNSAFTYICGGHTDGCEGFYMSCKGGDIPGILDSRKKNIDYSCLNSEKDAENWIDANPAAFCNLKKEQSKKAHLFSERYFRWEDTYSHKSLEDIIKRKTGEDIGVLYDIVSLERSCSGRIKVLEVLGDKKNIILTGDEKIRRTLSDTMLYSSCFVVEAELGEDGIPLEFTFRGAGYGSGAGMCLIGAIAMAKSKRGYKSIINHYYGGVSVKKIY